MSDYKIDTLEVETLIVAPVATTSVAGLHSATDKTKIDSIQSGATANQTDAFLLARANHTGTQLSSTVSDFSESVDDRVATLLQPGTNISLVYDDVLNTLTITSAGTYTDEQAQDAVGTILTDSATVDFTYNDAGNTITAIVIDGSITDAKVAVGISATKLGAGTVDNIELGYLDGVTSSIQPQLNNKQPLDGDLTALSALITTGFITRTATDTVATRVITGTATNILVTNGDGVLGNPTLDLINVGTAGTFGSASQVPVLTTDTNGRVTSVVNTPIAITGTAVSNTPAGNIAATTVQTAINELDVEKAKLVAGNTFTGDQSVTTGSVAVGTITQQASAILTLESTTQGMLIPRMTSDQRIAIATPANGLRVFDTNLNTSCEYSGTFWKFEYTLNTNIIQTSVLITYANILQLVTASLDVGLYVLELKGIMQSTATTTGVGLRLAAGTAAISTIVLNWGLSQAAAGTDKIFEYSQLDVADNVTSVSVATANANFPVFGDGVFRVTTAGTVAVQLRSELAAATSIRPDSVLILKKIG